jgi:tetratricopeptide (TPR) repeat protein
MKVRSLVVLLTISFNLGLIGFLPVNSVKAQENIPKYGNDSITCIENLSLYRESYKQWKQSKYKSPAIDHAIKYWYYVFEECPRSSENIYVDGAKMIDYYIQKAKTETERESLIDTLMRLYDKRVEYFPNHYKSGQSQVGSILGRKGVDLYQLRPSAYLEAYEILNESLELDGAEASGPVFVYYFRCVTKMAMKGDTDTAAVVDAYDLVGGYIESNIKNYRALGNEKKENEYINIMGNIENTFEPFAKCTDLVRIYQQKYDATPENVELLKKIVDILDDKKCVEDPLYFEATVSLYELEPTPESAYLIGKMYLMQERHKEAIPYMEAATEMEDMEKVDDAYIFLAQAYRSLDNFPKAREMALKAAATNTSWGEPYMFIGDLYALSAKACGDDDLTKKVAYWAAVDQYAKAKRVAPELTEAANKRINIYQAYFPPTELLFFHNLTEGDNYTVGCWINEVTTIRAAK